MTIEPPERPQREPDEEPDFLQGAMPSTFSVLVILVVVVVSTLLYIQFTN